MTEKMRKVNKELSVLRKLKKIISNLKKIDDIKSKKKTLIKLLVKAKLDNTKLYHSLQNNEFDDEIMNEITELTEIITTVRIPELMSLELFMLKARKHRIQQSILLSLAILAIIGLIIDETRITYGSLIVIIGYMSFKLGDKEAI